MAYDQLTEQQAFLAINGLPRIGPVTLQRLLEYFDNDVLRIFKASRSELMNVQGIGPDTADIILKPDEHFSFQEEEQKIQAHSARFITKSDENYPPLLKEIYDAPVGLYCKGNFDPQQVCIAIVGSRRCTIYGINTAKKLAQGLAKAGICVVSGLARGIDTAAHKGALEAGGKTIGVLGNGLDIVYPPENIDLYKEMAEKGAILSEFPFGYKATKQTFPMRNRIVAGICVGTIVIESNNNGGSMITARFTGECNRQIFAVPGRIDQTSSAGCHKLIKDGAVLVTDVQDILDELNFDPPQMDLFTNNEQHLEKTKSDLTADELEIINLFNGGESLQIDEISSKCNKTSHEVSTLLMMLELKKLIVKKIDGNYEAN